MAGGPERGGSRLRALVLGLGGAEAALWLLVLANGLLSGSDPATKGLDRDAATIATAVFGVSTLPALALAWSGRAIRLALLLAFLPVLAVAVGAIWFAKS